VGVIFLVVKVISNDLTWLLWWLCILLIPKPLPFFGNRNLAELICIVHVDFCHFGSTLKICHRPWYNAPRVC